MAKAGAKLGLPGKLPSLDATVIDLCASIFDWAQFRTTKGAVKLHLLLDQDGYLPCYAVITEGKVHEIQVARTLSFQRGTMLVFDRGYTDYGWFQRLTEEGVQFVTRLKDNATYMVWSSGNRRVTASFPTRLSCWRSKPPPSRLPSCGACVTGMHRLRRNWSSLPINWTWKRSQPLPFTNSDGK
ncbi:MAG: transposase [Acidobacteriota bacterium]|nr:transposase [Acidobacteriota bacterium]